MNTPVTADRATMLAEQYANRRFPDVAAHWDKASDATKEMWMTAKHAFIEGAGSSAGARDGLCNCGWPRTTDGEHGDNCPARITPEPSVTHSADEPRDVLLGKSLRQYAHAQRIAACGAWSAVTKLPIEMDEAKCDEAAAQEERLRCAIDELADLSKPSPEPGATLEHPRTHAAALLRIEACVREIQIIAAEFGYDPVQWLIPEGDDDMAPQSEPCPVCRCHGGHEAGCSTLTKVGE